ncbi:MAG: 2-C-methyl-D-erythritol 4-phosphate cytidylyltransferase [Balneolaceae bacterium]|nr:2-C-methyl-D-erythritol 4-phosphate cytidylyltransferase [Balneolaceae bacterium]
MAKQQLALIIPAAGKGERLGAEIPKPYIKVAGKTILEYTLLKFRDVTGLGEVIVSTSMQYVDTTQEVLSRVFPDLNYSVVEGGEERQDSIRNAIEKISDKTGLIAVHDAVRPFVSKEEIENCVEEASRSGGAVLAIPARDTIKVARQNLEIAETPNRERLWQAQTPQVFWAALLREAYQYAAEHKFLGSDDSSLVEKIGGKVVLVRGSSKNFKITHPYDLDMARYLIEEGAE